MTALEEHELLYVLKPSSIAGIGVFTVKDIPMVRRLFSGKHQARKLKIQDVPAEFIKYCIYVNDEELICPERFDRMEIGWYLNHSENPNIGKDSEKRTISLRHINAGEELLIDYNTLNEPEHLKEAYYKKD